MEWEPPEALHGLEQGDGQQRMGGQYYVARVRAGHRDLDTARSRRRQQPAPLLVVDEQLIGAVEVLDLGGRRSRRSDDRCRREWVASSDRSPAPGCPRSRRDRYRRSAGDGARLDQLGHFGVGASHVDDKAAKDVGGAHRSTRSVAVSQLVTPFGVIRTTSVNLDSGSAGSSNGSPPLSSQQWPVVSPVDSHPEAQRHVIPGPTECVVEGHSSGQAPGTHQRLATADDRVDPDPHLILDAAGVAGVDRPGRPARFEPSLQPRQPGPHHPGCGHGHDGQSDQEKWGRFR